MTVDLSREQFEALWSQVSDLGRDYWWVGPVMTALILVLVWWRGWLKSKRDAEAQRPRTPAERLNTLLLRLAGNPHEWELIRGDTVAYKPSRWHHINTKPRGISSYSVHTNCPYEVSYSWDSERDKLSVYVNGSYVQDQLYHGAKQALKQLKRFKINERETEAKKQQEEMLTASVNKLETMTQAQAATGAVTLEVSSTTSSTDWLMEFGDQLFKQVEQALRLVMIVDMSSENGKYELPNDHHWVFASSPKMWGCIKYKNITVWPFGSHDIGVILGHSHDCNLSSLLTASQHAVLSELLRKKISKCPVYLQFTGRQIQSHPSGETAPLPGGTRRPKEGEEDF